MARVSHLWTLEVLVANLRDVIGDMVTRHAYVFRSQVRGLRTPGRRRMYKRPIIVSLAHSLIQALPTSLLITHESFPTIIRSAVLGVTLDAGERLDAVTPFLWPPKWFHERSTCIQP